MRNDWPLRFRHFSLSIDTVDEENYRRIQKTLRDYLCKCLGASFFQVLIDGFQVPVDGTLRPCLSTVWAAVADGSWSQLRRYPPILDSDSRPYSQATYAYHFRKPLWITTSGRSTAPLVGARTSLDQWSNAKDLPAYLDYGRGDSRTSVLMPLEYDGRLFGVLNIEFRERLCCSEPAKLAARAITSSLARVIWLHEAHVSRKRSTNRALEQLESLDPRISSPLDPRTVFLASSDRSDPAVMAVLRNVLRSFSNLFILHDWAEETSSGSIAEQIHRDIRSCEFGVCYMSELPREGRESEHEFLDNPNVLFEAGMMQMLEELREPDFTGTSRWIPVREDHKLTSAPPFDFTGERIVIVQRDTCGGLLKEDFENRFREAVQSQIRDLAIK